MKKKFDFKSQSNISFWKKIRISPDFPLFKKEIFLFLFFLIIIFIFTLVFSSTKKMQKLINFVQELSLNYEVKASLNYSDLEKNTDIFIEKLENSLHKLETALPDLQYSYTQEIIIAMKEIIVITKQIKLQISDLKLAIQKIINQGSGQSLLIMLKNNEKKLHNLAKQVTTITQKIKKNKHLLPTNFIENIFLLEKLFNNFELKIAATYQVLGEKYPHNIIIWLENTNEKRATGGFIGSFLELVINDGKIIKNKFHDIYDYDGQITQKNSPPRLVKTLVGNKSWSLRDTNYSPIFAKSAQTFLTMFENAGGNSIDTVISINQELVEAVLQKIGPIYLKDLDLELNSQNFSFVLSYLVEGKINQNHPKKFLAEKIIPIFITKIKKNLSVNLFKEIWLEQKNNIQIFSQEDAITAVVKTFFNNNKDFIYQDNIIFINKISISGNKSDFFVQEKFSTKEKIINNKKQITITLNRFHSWNKKAEQLFQDLYQKIPGIKTSPPRLKKLLGKGSNNRVLQFFLPQKSNNFSLSHPQTKLDTWMEKNKKIVEINLPLLYPQEKDSISFSFEVPLNLNPQIYFND